MNTSLWLPPLIKTSKLESNHIYPLSKEYLQTVPGMVLSSICSCLRIPLWQQLGRFFIASIQSDDGDGGDDDGDDGGDDGLQGDAGWVLHTGFIPATSCQSTVAVVKKQV